GVEEVAHVDHLPLTYSQFSTTFSATATADVNQLPVAALRLVNDKYFSVLSIPVLQGRGFNEFDGTEAQPVAVISQTMARKFWSNQDPIGQTVASPRADVNGSSRKHVIVGVVGDVRDGIDTEPQPTLYIPFSQMSF